MLSKKISPKNRENYNDLVQVIENVKVHFIKLEKMNKYLKSFIPK